MRALIAGGGIGGLTAALCLLHHGIDIQVFEQAEALEEVGAGIQLSPNALKVFEALGIGDEIVDRGFLPEFIEARMGLSGRKVFNIPLQETTKVSWGSPYIHIHRADLLDVLKNALNSVSPSLLSLGSKIESYENIANYVTAITSGGDRFTGDLLIGADGIHSNMREQMLGQSKPDYTGNKAWRFVVPTHLVKGEKPNPSACVWMGPGRHAVTYYLREGELINFVGVVEESESGSENWFQKGVKSDVLADFKGWHPVISNIIEAAKPDAIFKWGLYDRNPLPKWTDRRVALLGDACHPMLPFLAQGAAMAIEDSWSMARSLVESKDDVSLGMKHYQSQRAKCPKRKNVLRSVKNGLLQSLEKISVAANKRPVSKNPHRNDVTKAFIVSAKELPYN